MNPIRLKDRDFLGAVHAVNAKLQESWIHCYSFVAGGFSWKINSAQMVVPTQNPDNRYDPMI